jgi:hypothetical protein
MTRSCCAVTSVAFVALPQICCFDRKYCPVLRVIEADRASGDSAAMDRIHVLQLVAAFVAGAVIGFGFRALISARRRKKARQRRHDFE